MYSTLETISEKLSKSENILENSILLEERDRSSILLFDLIRSGKIS